MRWFGFGGEGKDVGSIHTFPWYGMLTGALAFRSCEMDPFGVG